ncbi:MAG: LuxR C-terminal-related transcriptional regulator [Bacteroidales bacterium]|nr:LuxR C-terminal-related transcriptional regulator [Bacteroidales bacterium]
MLRYLVYSMFIVSIALAAVGIILSTRLKSRFRSEIFSSLLYFEVFIYTFGFYGIWGQVIIKEFLSPFISQEQVSRFSDISILMGLPFLVFAWLMLIRFVSGLSGRKKNNLFVSLFLFFNFSLLFLIGYLITHENNLNHSALIKKYYIIMNLAYSFAAVYLIHIPLKGRPVIHDYDRKIIAPALFMIMILQCLPLIFYPSLIWPGIIFILAFFAGNTFLPVYLNYGTLITALTEDTGYDLTYEQFFKKFGISPRETDIVYEICNGLSNKEISDKLFISLQTVKDHTHRIYFKTNVKNRVQLINLVRELK